MFRIALKGILGRKARLVLTSLAVILGTAFLSGTAVFSATLNRTFDNLFSDVFRNVDSYVRSTQVIEADFGAEERQRIPAELIAMIEAVPGVGDVQADIQAFARIIGKDGEPLGSDGAGPPTFGSVGEEFQGALWTISEGRFASGPNEVVLDEAAAKAGKFVLNDKVKVVAQAGSREFTLVGIASYGDVRSPGGATFALFDSATASEFLTKPGFIDAILVSGDGSVSDAKLSAAIQAVIPATAKTETLTGAQITLETQDQIGSALDFFGILLQTFSFIALGVGCFVIYNVFSISAAQRQRERPNHGNHRSGRLYDSHRARQDNLRKSLQHGGYSHGAR
jgi:putative ABC transport system permease protein